MSSTTPCAATGRNAGGLLLQIQRHRRSDHAVWALSAPDARHDLPLASCVLAGGDLPSRLRAGAAR